MSDLITTPISQLAWQVLEPENDQDFGRASLVLHWGQTAEVVQLSGRHDSVVVGRSHPADVCVKSPSLSRQHARFSLRDGVLRVEDLGSMNGTLVAGSKVKDRVLRPLDQVVLGDVIVHISLATPRGPQEHVGQTAPAADGLVLASSAMKRLYQLAAKLAQTDVSVLIIGETGTGKEHLAQALHDLGPRKSQPFRVVNCGAIPEGLAESLLFGHERGAFTGAGRTRVGVFEDARDGTVFLDEIGELPLATQAKLLRVLETRQVTRVGGQRPIPLGMRVVAATHCDLDRMVEEQTFRRDLLYRLNAVALSVPPLRERREEIAPLARKFVQLASDTWNLPACEIDDAALKALEHYAWPGNIRHLRNVIERATLLCRAGRITPVDLPEPVQGAPTEGRHRGGASNGGPQQSLPAEVEPATASASDAPFKEQVQALETRLIRQALSETGGNQRAAAKLLRMPRRTLAYKIKTLAIEATPDASE